MIEQICYNGLTTANRRYLAKGNVPLLQLNRARFVPVSRGKPTGHKAGAFYLWAKMNALSDVQKAYLAGLIDGEGCITILKQVCGRDKGKENPHYYYRVVVIVNMTDEKLMKYCCDTTGLGHVYKKQLRKDRIRNQWSWQLGQRESIELLRVLRDYVILKREQLDLALEFSHLPTFSGGRGKSRVPTSVLAQREAMFLRMKALKWEMN